MSCSVPLRLCAWHTSSGMCCSVLRCVVVCCSVLQCVAVSCCVLQCEMFYYGLGCGFAGMLQYNLVCCGVLQCVNSVCV